MFKKNVEHPNQIENVFTLYIRRLAGIYFFSMINQWKQNLEGGHPVIHLESHSFPLGFQEGPVGCYCP
jgi:hypothetical protein